MTKLRGKDEKHLLTDEGLARLSSSGQKSDRHKRRERQQADRRTTQRALDRQGELNRRETLSPETSSIHDDARNPENPPDNRLPGTERVGHAKKLDIDSDSDTGTSTATDEITSVFWSSGTDDNNTTPDNSRRSGGTLEAGEVVADVAQQSTRASSVSSIWGPHVDPPTTPPRSPPSIYETVLLHLGDEKTPSVLDSKRLKSLLSAVRVTPPARSRSGDGGRGGSALVAAEIDIVSLSRAGASAGQAVRRDGDESNRGGESDGGGGARKGDEKYGSACVRGDISEQQSSPGLSRKTHHVPRHPGARHTPEAQIAEGGAPARVLEETGGTQRPPAKSTLARRPRSLPLCVPPVELWADLLDAGHPSPEQRGKESVPPQRRKGEVGERGDGRDGQPGSSAKVALSADHLKSLERLRRRCGAVAGEQGRHEEGNGGGGGGCSFFPVAVHPPANALSRGRSLSAASPTRSSRPRAELFKRTIENLEQEQAAASVAARAVVGAAVGAAAGDDGGVVCVAEPPLEGGSLLVDRRSSFSSPSVWVTWYMDYSSTHGLVFMLSDGSIGVIFRDHTKIVVDLTADTFDYTEPRPPSTTTALPPSPPSPSPSPQPGLAEAERQVRGGNGDAPKDPYPRDSTTTTRRYALDYYPFYLRNKVGFLMHLREHVLPNDGHRGESGSEAVAAAVAHGKQVPLTFIEKWQDVGNTTCLQLSNQTMQVLFSDGAAVLLSKDCRSVTVLDTEQKIQPRPKAEQWDDTTKERIRQAKDAVANFLEGSQANAGSGRLQKRRKALTKNNTEPPTS